MWEHYRKTLIPTQVFVLVACLVVRWYLNAPWPAVIVVFFTMQIASVFGAAWGARLKRRMQEREEELPLQRRQL